MEVRTTGISLSTNGDGQVIDITAPVQQGIEEAGVVEGQVSAFVRGSTAAIATM